MLRIHGVCLSVILLVLFVNRDKPLESENDVGNE